MSTPRLPRRASPPSAPSPALDAVLVQVAPEPAEGDFGPVDTALATLAANTAVVTATLDKAVSDASVPPPPSLLNYSFDDPRLPNGGPPSGTGNNWGLESSRFPDAWNVLDKVRRRNAQRRHDRLRLGFDTHHDDLRTELTVQPVCNDRGDLHVERDHRQRAATTARTSPAPSARSTTPGDPRRRARASAGANPAAQMFGRSVAGAIAGHATSTRPIVRSQSTARPTSANWGLWQRMLDEKNPAVWPNLRVINMSADDRGADDRVGDAGGIHGGQLRAGRERRRGRDRAVHAEYARHRSCRSAGDGTFARRVAEKASREERVAHHRGRQRQQQGLRDATTSTPIAGARPGGTCRPASSSRSSTRARRMRSAGPTPTGRPAPTRSSWSTPIGTDNELATLLQRRRRCLGARRRHHEHRSRAPYDLDAAARRWRRRSSPRSPACLLAYDPTLTRRATCATRSSAAQRRRHHRRCAPADRRVRVAAPRSTASAKDLADFNDHSIDGNRRVITRCTDRNTRRPTRHEGPSVRVPVHPSPDGTGRHARLPPLPRRAARGMPARPGSAAARRRATIQLDGAPTTPKKDLNYDGCVSAPAARRATPKKRWSRFDLNGDGMLDPHRTRRDRRSAASAAAEVSDLDMFTVSFEDGRRRRRLDQAGQLRDLLTSGDLEIHADTMFHAGATEVDVEVRYGPARRSRRARSIDKRGDAIVVTVPTRRRGRQTVRGRRPRRRSTASRSTRSSSTDAVDRRRRARRPLHADARPSRRRRHARSPTDVEDDRRVRRCNKCGDTPTPLEPHTSSSASTTLSAERRPRAPRRAPTRRPTRTARRTVELTSRASPRTTSSPRPRHRPATTQVTIKDARSTSPRRRTSSTGGNRRRSSGTWHEHSARHRVRRGSTRTSTDRTPFTGTCR